MGFLLKGCHYIVARRDTDRIAGPESPRNIMWLLHFVGHIHLKYVDRAVLPGAWDAGILGVPREQWAEPQYMQEVHFSTGSTNQCWHWHYPNPTLSLCNRRPCFKISGQSNADI